MNTYLLDHTLSMNAATFNSNEHIFVFAIVVRSIFFFEDI